MIITVKGRVFKGPGDGKKFTELPWVKRQFKEKLGFEPYSGTLNLSLHPNTEALSLLNRFKGWRIQPEKGYFPGRFYKALIMQNVHGAVVRPEVPGYPDNILEVVAPICLREKFHLKAGDEVEVKIWLE